MTVRESIAALVVALLVAPLVLALGQGAPGAPRSVADEAAGDAPAHAVDGAMGVVHATRAVTPREWGAPPAIPARAPTEPGLLDSRTGAIARPGERFSTRALPVATFAVRADGATDAEDPGGGGGCTVCLTIAENWTRTAPWYPVNPKSAFNASDDGVILRVGLAGPLTGTHRVEAVLREPNGAVWWTCEGNVGEPGVQYAYLVVVCLIQNETGEGAVADVKVRAGTWTWNVTADGVAAGTRTFTMSRPGIRVGMHGLITGHVPPGGRFTSSDFWSGGRTHVANWTLNNTGTSSAYVRGPAAGRGAFVQIEGPGVDAFAHGPGTEFPTLDAAGGANGRAYAYAPDILPGERLTARIAWTPGDLLNDPPTLRWRGLIRLTPHIWMVELPDWVEIPVKATIDAGREVWFYPNYVNPDADGENDFSWPTAQYLAGKQQEMWEKYRDAYFLNAPTNVNGRTFFSLRNGTGACGLGGTNGGMDFMNCGFKGNALDMDNILHIHAMEFHHAILFPPSYSWGPVRMDDVLEGCAEVGQDWANRTWSLGRYIGAVRSFLDADLDRNPLNSESPYGASFLWCQMVVDLRGENIQDAIADELDAANEYRAYEAATGLNSSVTSVFWRWYVQDRHHATPTYPEKFMQNVPEPLVDVGASGGHNAVTPDLPTGRVWSTRFHNFTDDTTWSVTVTPPSALIGGSYDVRLYAWDSNANAGVGAAREMPLAGNVAAVIPSAWIDDPDDRVGVTILTTSSPWFVANVHALSVTGVPLCVPGGGPC